MNWKFNLNFWMHTLHENACQYSYIYICTHRCKRIDRYNQTASFTVSIKCDYL